MSQKDGSPNETRTRVTALKALCPNLWTMGPFLAEDVGFEPTERCRSTDFKSAAIDHSANPPLIDYKHVTGQVKTYRKAPVGPRK